MKFEKPEVEIIPLETVDIVTASGDENPQGSTPRTPITPKTE